MTRDLAAPFTLRPSLPAQLPHWLPLTVTLQAAIALIALVVAAPFVIQLLPAIEMPSLGNVFIQLQTQWMTWLDMLSPSTKLAGISNASHSNILVRTLQHIFDVCTRGCIHALAGGERVVVEKSNKIIFSQGRGHPAPTIPFI